MDIWAGLIRLAKTEFEDEGVDFVYSTFRLAGPDSYDLHRFIQRAVDEDGRPLYVDYQVAPGVIVTPVVNDELLVVGGRVDYDSTLDIVRAGQLAAAMPPGRFAIRLKFVRHPQQDEPPIVVDGQDILHESKGGAVLTVSGNVPPGRLVGIDEQYYDPTYPASAVVYGFTRVVPPGQAPLMPMRVGDYNCVAMRLREHYNKKLRGGGLTTNRASALDEWEERVREPGATLEDVGRLETKLKQGIRLVDISSGVIYDSGKYIKGGHPPVTLIAHNAHAWSPDTSFPPITKVKTFCDSVWDAISRESAPPHSVWLIGEDDGNYDEFVLADGTLCRSERRDRSVSNACLDYVGTNMTDPTIMKLCGVTFEDFERGDADEFSVATTLSNMVMGKTHAANVLARILNGWKRTPVKYKSQIDASCIEGRHGGVWNAEAYHVERYVSIDIKEAYPACFRGLGECRPYYERYGHPEPPYARIKVDGPLPANDYCGFAQIKSWRFHPDCHPILPAWFGMHFETKGWAPVVLLRFMVDTCLLVELTIGDVVLSLNPQWTKWLPPEKDTARHVIGCFTQGAREGGRRLTRRLVVDEEEARYIQENTMRTGSFLGAKRCPLGLVLEYYEGRRPQYTHLRASMLSYSYINLLAMLRRIPVKDAVRVATDSIYVPADLDLSSIESFASGKSVSPGRWRKKDELMYPPKESAAYQSPELMCGEHELDPSTAPSHEDPIARSRVSYLYGGGGSGKSYRVFNLFKGAGGTKDLIAFAPIHRLVKQHITDYGRRTCTYNSFFHWAKGPWDPKCMGQTYIPRIIIWDEVCMVDETILRIFTEYLLGKGCQIIFLGDPAQPPPIKGTKPHDWLMSIADYHEELTTDHRAKCPRLRALKRRMRGRSDAVACSMMRGAIPAINSWENTLEEWRPGDTIYAARRKMRGMVERSLLQWQREHFPNDPIPISYDPENSRQQNCEIAIPGTDRRENIVRHDVVEVPYDVAIGAIATKDWRLGYSFTCHCTIGLTVPAPLRVWIIDENLGCDNLGYLSVSRFQYLDQIRRTRGPGCINQPKTDGDPYSHYRRQITRRFNSYGVRCFNDIANYVEVRSVISNQNGRCPKCDVVLHFGDVPNWVPTGKDGGRASLFNLAMICAQCHKK